MANGIFLSLKWPSLHFMNPEKHQGKWISKSVFCIKVDKWLTNLKPVILIFWPLFSTYYRRWRGTKRFS